MASATVDDLRTQADAAWRAITRQLRGMEPYIDRSDAPGEWTTREVLSHLLFEPGFRVADFLETFSEHDPPLRAMEGGTTYVTDERRGMSLEQLVEALDAQRRAVFAYLDRLTDADVAGRTARIPFFKQFMGTDEIPLQVYARALFDLHWNDHAGQLAKIRKAVGLPDAT